MKTVRDVLNQKENAIWSIGPDASVFEALQAMAEKNIGALLVMDGGELIGIVSERDYARKVALKGKSSKDVPVREIMTSDVIYVRPEQSVEECMAVMTRRHFRHLPVLEGKRVVGVISLGDVVKSIIEQDKFIIEQLENYIRGGR